MKRYRFLNWNLSDNDLQIYVLHSKGEQGSNLYIFMYESGFLIKTRLNIVIQISSWDIFHKSTVF